MNNLQCSKKCKIAKNCDDHFLKNVVGDNFHRK